MNQVPNRVIIRMPDDMKAFVASQAAKNGSSQNSEVLRAIRERMERIRREEMPVSTGE